MDLVFKALSDKNRRALLDGLRIDNGQTLRDLCDGVSMSRQAVSKHLRILEDAGLVSIIWRGREKVHFLNPVPINELAERWISKFDRPRLEAISELKNKLENHDGKE